MSFRLVSSKTPRVLGSRQAGFSLVELGVALVALGIVLVAALAYWKTATQARHADEQAGVLAQSQQAMVAFAHVHFRLPCPDTDQDGLENCTGGVARVGQLPWRTLQLHSSAARQLRYGVDRQPHADAWQNRDLAVAMDRMRPLVSVGSTPSAMETLLGNSNLLDFCAALHLGIDASLPSTRLVVNDLDAVPSVSRAMAYVLVAPGLGDADGDGHPLDGLNRSASDASPVFESGHRSRSEQYDDTVLAVRPDVLFADLQCAQALSAISHSHANAALAAALTRRGLDDFRYQLKVKAVLAGAGVASATASQLMAIAGLANSIAALANATAFTTITLGTTGALIGWAIASVAANTLAVAMAVVPLATSIAVAVEAGTRVTRGDELFTEAEVLSTAVDLHMRAADQGGF